MKKRYAIGICLGLLILCLVCTSLLGYALIRNLPPAFEKPKWPDFKNSKTESNLSGILKFNSEEEFKDYLIKSQSLAGGLGYGFSGRGASNFLSAAESSDSSMMEKTFSSNYTPAPDRFSETNVQVAGIDEPDIIKTNGKQIFYAKEPKYFYDYVPTPLSSEETITRENSGESSADSSPTSDVKKVVPPITQPDNLTTIINALPAETISQIGKIESTGNLLLDGQILIVIGNDNQIKAYNISDPAKPVEKWSFKIKDNNYLVTSRLYQNNIYLVIQTYVNSRKPCPFELADLNNKTISIGCTDIYHPTQPSQAEATYSIVKIDSNTGQSFENVSFLGSYDNSVIYMSDSNIYLTYSEPKDFLALFSDFLSENSDLYPADVRSKLNRLESYELSSNAKMVELQNILDTYQSSLSEDEMLKLQNEQENRIKSYLQKHGREMEKTGIIRLSSEDLSIKANGIIPGRLLNQFSMDEYQNHLRVATTVEGNNWYFGSWSGASSNSFNDLYVLDQNLKQTGSVLDLGKGERIYSARFIQDKGYIVTFKETDPFYVFDLSDSNNPKLSGELKIPGYSSYLHPISDNIILGVGKEDSNVKLSLFDVSNPSKPQELDKYILNEYWSEAIYNHHAFLQDDKNSVFFLPGGQGGYIFGYADNKLKLVKAISDYQVKRAVYINNYFYILSEEKIVVFDEKTWEKVSELELK